MVNVSLPRPFRKPRSRAQAAALTCPATFLKYGGAAGSLKTSTAIEAAAQFRDNPHMFSIILRKTALELRDIMNEADQLYSQAAGKMNWSEDTCYFPSGARVMFGYAVRDREIHKYQGPSFSFIDFDESVFFGEYAIRFMFSRLRSASRIPLRLWLTTNPGGVSHDMHMHIFQGKTCIHCNSTKDSRKAYVIYNDATWPSDGRPVWDREVSPSMPVTTCFIPGRIVDHDIYGKKGERYLGSLGALDAKLREAMMNGCWAQFLGQYFDVWNPNIHVVQRHAIREANWWPYWSGGDYGFKKSWAADYLFTRDPEGHIYTLAEIAENHFKARDFGARVRAEWFPDDFRISQANYLSPDCWAQRGDDQTLADQIEDEGRGLICTPASTDRAGGAQLVYTLLSDQKLFVTEDCPLLIKAIPSRIHDEREPTKVKKVDGDPCDDAWDAWRYGVYSHCREAQEPWEMRIQRRVTAEDPTTRAMQRRIAERDLEQEDETGSVMDYVGWSEWRDV